MWFYIKYWLARIFLGIMCFCSGLWRYKKNAADFVIATYKSLLPNLTEEDQLKVAVLFNDTILKIGDCDTVDQVDLVMVAMCQELTNLEVRSTNGE